MKYLFPVLFVMLSYMAKSQTARITFKVPQLYPEGIAYYPKGNIFFISSARSGTVGSLDMQGNYKVFYKDSSLKSTFGMKVDNQNHLWVCAGDPNYSKYSDSSTFKKMAHLVCFDAATGKKLKEVDLSGLYNGDHFPNDVATGDNGDLYVTDSYSPVIYKVDASGHATLFAQNDLFKSPMIGLNGIVYHPDGFLLVVNNSTGAILKVDAANPANVTRVKVNTFFPGADGLLLDKQNNLILIQNRGINKVSSLTSTDQWKSATVKMATAMEDRFANPSTGTFANGKIYVVNSMLNEFSSPTLRPSKEFSIQVAELKPVK